MQAHSLHAGAALPYKTKPPSLAANGGPTIQ